MPTDVVMPQMGESIAEGTIVRWIKKVGDAVDRDEPLFEISTDKVDAEIPSPAAGVVSEIRAKEGDTVPVNSVVAVIGAAGEVSTAPTAPKAPPPAPVASPVKAVSPAPATQTAALHAESGADALRERSSPLVRKIAKDNNVDISQIQGTGIAGRVTKDDILGFIGGQVGQVGQVAQVGKSQPTPTAPRSTGAPGDEIVKMSVMRKKIAEHMVVSRRTAAHVHSVFEVNFSRVAQIREAKKAEFERAGAKLTYLSFILKAAVDALRAVPIVNASVDGDTVIYHKDVNVGIAVALDWGLIVPVIKQADERNLIGLSRALSDLAGRARTKQLKPEEVSGGTFTITNPGVFGALFGMPIINQPQLAILGVGNVEKRPVVIDDAIAIRPMGYLTLGYDHRIIDGAVADEFMSHLKRSLENWDPATV
jgi:pyruvate dehydrogenase E2 component (dihydrolipoamide acetyltransferase)